MIARRSQSPSVCDRDVGADPLRLSRLFLDVTPQLFRSKLGPRRFRLHLGGLKRRDFGLGDATRPLPVSKVAISAGRISARCGVARVGTDSLGSDFQQRLLFAS